MWNILVGIKSEFRPICLVLSQVEQVRNSLIYSNCNMRTKGGIVTNGIQVTTKMLNLGPNSSISDLKGILKLVNFCKNSKMHFYTWIIEHCTKTRMRVTRSCTVSALGEEYVSVAWRWQQSDGLCSAPSSIAVLDLCSLSLVASPLSSSRHSFH